MANQFSKETLFHKIGTTIKKQDLCTTESLSPLHGSIGTSPTGIQIVESNVVGEDFLAKSLLPSHIALFMAQTAF